MRRKVLVSCNSCFITLPTSLELVWIYIYQRNLLSNEVKSNEINAIKSFLYMPYIVFLFLKMYSILQVIWRHKMATVFQKCAVFLPLFLINRLLYHPKINFDYLIVFVSPISAGGSLTKSLFFKKSYLTRHRSFSIRNTGIVY